MSKPAVWKVAGLIKGRDGARTPQWLETFVVAADVTHATLRFELAHDVIQIRTIDWQGEAIV